MEKVKGSYCSDMIKGSSISSKCWSHDTVFVFETFVVPQSVREKHAVLSILLGHSKNVSLIILNQK